MAEGKRASGGNTNTRNAEGGKRTYVRPRTRFETNEDRKVRLHIDNWKRTDQSYPAFIRNFDRINQAYRNMTGVEPVEALNAGRPTKRGRNG